MPTVQVDPLRREEGARQLTQYQRDALTLLRARLDTLDPGFMGSEEVRAALNTIKPYIIEAITQLDVAAGGSSWKREYNAHDLVRVRRLRRIHRLHILRANWDEARRGYAWSTTNEAAELAKLETKPEHIL